MTSFVSGQGTVGGISGQLLDVIELRVISNILQGQNPNSAQQELSGMRNDEAFGLGIVPPVVPGN